MSVAPGFAFLRTLVALAALAAAPAAMGADVTGKWHGFWTAPEGWSYEADLTLSVGDGNQLTGDIRWTLRKSPREGEQAKLGRSGVEHVRGFWFPEAGAVRMQGISLDDPDHILGTDVYRLVLSDDGRVMAGITAHHGSWTALFVLTRP